MLRRAVLAFSLALIPGLAWAANQNPDGGGPRSPTNKAAPKPAAAKRKVSRYAPVELYEVNTKETLRLRFYDDGGKPIKGWQKRFDRFMRCHTTGAVHRMDQRLARMLYQIGRHFDGHRLEVISGYRHPKVARNPRSPHKEGLACDFRIPGIANPTLRDYLRKTFDHAGVGYYPNSTFVHLDNRKDGRKAFWIDYSGPGEAANYAENPDDDLRSGRVERGRVAAGDAAGRAGGDSLALAGAESSPSKPRAPAKSTPPVKPPVEIKPSNPFGD